MGIDGTSSHLLSDADRANIRTAVAVASSCFFSSSPTPTALDAAFIEGVILEAYVAASTNYGVREAQAWAKGFSFRNDAPTVYTRDADLFRSSGNDIEAVCHIHHQALAPNRLSTARVLNLLGTQGEKCPGVSKEDFERISRIAAEGVRITTPPGFTPCSRPPAMRTKYKETSNAINKLMFKQFNNHTVILIPTDLAVQIPGIHYSSQHWAPKKGKMQGRAICDTANRTDGIPINGRGDDVRSQVEAEWGPIHHPTIEDIATMVLIMADRHGWDNIELWKVDLSGAFNLIRFHPESVKLLAFELTEGITAIHITGMFGWTGTPYAFQVITRVLATLVGLVILGICLWYVDDGMGVSKKGKDRENDMKNTVNVIHQLLGDDAVAMDKCEHGRRVEMIGWVVDLDKRIITMSRRSFLKTVHAFFLIDTEAHVHYRELEILGSLASRYAMLCRQMKPHTKAIYAMLSGFNGRTHVAHKLSAAAKYDILMWRSYLCQLGFDENGYARPITTFRKEPPSLQIEYDASLNGFGVGLYELNPDSGNLTLLAYTQAPTWAPVGDDASYQNTCEYGAVILGLLMARALGKRDLTYRLIGDSVSSLAWCSSDRANSELARATNIGFVTLTVEMNAEVAGTEHLAGILNTTWDGLSRGKTGPELGLDARLFMPTQEGSLFTEYLRLCDPTTLREAVVDQIELSKSFIRLLRENPPGDRPR